MSKVIVGEAFREGIKRSQLARASYVRMRSDVEFRNRFLRGRYFYVLEVDDTHDQADNWGPCLGVPVLYGESQFLEWAFNNDMDPISEAEEMRLSEIFERREEKQLFHTGTELALYLRRLEVELLKLHVDICLFHYPNVESLIDDLVEKLKERVPDASDETLRKIIDSTEIRYLWAKADVTAERLDELEAACVRNDPR